MGKRVLSIKENKQKSKLPILAVVSMFLLIALVAVIVKDKDFKFVKPVVEKEEKPEDVKFVPSAETVERSEDVFNFIEIMKNQNKALNLSPDSAYGFPGVPSELNEYPIYKTCDGRVMPNTINPFATYSWAMLLYATLYDMTGDEEYVNKIRETEEKLYKLSELVRLRETITMFHQLYQAYELLEGKEILSDEKKFMDVFLSEILDFSYENVKDVNFMIVQDTAMTSVAFIDAAKIYSDRKENLEKIDFLVDYAEQLNDKAKTIFENPTVNQDGMRCWLLWSEFNIDRSKGENLDKYEKKLLSKEFLEEISDNEVLAANALHPCMEVMLDIYKETENEMLLDKFNEFKGYFGDKSDTEMKCAVDNKNAIRNKFYDDKGGVYFISDNAYNTYLLNEYNKLKSDSDG